MGRTSTKLRSNKITKISVVVLGLVFSMKTLAAEILIDRLIAEVNGEPITYSKVLEKVEKGPLVQVSPYPKNQSDNQIEIALHDLINFTLILQKAEEFEIDIDEQKLDEEINSFIDKRGMTIESLKAALRGQNMEYSQYRQDFRNQLILRQFQGRAIWPLIKITDKDIEFYYMKKSGSAVENLKVTLRQIFVRVDPEANSAFKNGKSQLAKKIYQKIEDGMPFDEAVRVYSDNSESKKNGGLMPPLYLKDMAKPFRAAIEPLTSKETTMPIETPNGFYIFYVEEKSIAGSSDYLKKKPKIESQLRQEKITQQTIHWLKQERLKSDIRILTDDL